MRILASGKGWKLQAEKNGKLHYKYAACPDMSFDFSLLCEVGEQYKPPFIEAIKDLGLVVKTIETDDDYYEAI
jgi:hypothetical protein